MAEKDDNSLIGYDPLAWMNASGADQQIEFQDTNPVDADISEDNKIVEQIAELPVLDGNSILAMQAEPYTAYSAANENSCHISLDAVQNIQNVVELHECLLSALTCNDKIEIDASAITMIDTATLQLLLILKQTAIKLQKQVIIDFPSDKFVESAGLLGLAEMLEVNQAAAGFF